MKQWCSCYCNNAETVGCDVWWQRERKRERERETSLQEQKTVVVVVKVICWLKTNKKKCNHKCYFKTVRFSLYFRGDVYSVPF
jgi:hypothetical protein